MGEMGGTVGVLWSLGTARLERCGSWVGVGCSGHSEERMARGRVGMGVGEGMWC